MNSNKGTSFASGVAFMTVSAIIVKLIGVCYKIPLVRLLGTQGMGYFNAAYDVYALLCMISTTGLPVAVSIMMNKYKGQHRRIFLLSLYVFMILGTIGTAGVFLMADHISKWIGAPEAAQSLRFIAPAVLFVCLSGALRGYYQGKRNMIPTAISQVIEAAGKLLFGLLFAYLSIRSGKGTIATAAFSVLGLSVGMLLCLIYLCICYKIEPLCDDEKRISWSLLLKQLLTLAFPVTLGAAVSGLTKMIDLGLIMRRLQDIGMSSQSAVSLYGCYSAMVVPLYSAVPALFGSVSMPLIPHLSHAISSNEINQQSQLLSTTFRLTASVSIPASIGMGMLGDMVLRLLYGNTMDARAAIPLLLIMSMAVPAACLITATSAILQAYGCAWIPMLSTAIGCIAKAVVLYILTGVSTIGIMAAPISTLICAVLIVCINLAFISKIAPKYSFSDPWIKVCAIAIASIGVSALVKRMLLNKTDSVIIIISITMSVAILLYAILAFRYGMLRLTDIMPNKEKEQKKYGYSRHDSKASFKD